MPDALAVIAGKLSAMAIRAVGAGLGSNVPGRVARAISPAVLSNLSRQSRLGVLAISGTNGKSTTSGFVSSILAQAGLRVAHNKQGANLVPGITASLVDAAGWDGNIRVDYCLFETDEAALPLVAREVPIKTVVVTNLFRDQLDRFGELDTTGTLISKGIAANRSRAILNADDPNVAQLAPDSERLFYGIENLIVAAATVTGGNVTELANCKQCGGEYAYDIIFYGQLGHYRCNRCELSRPLPDVQARDVEVTAVGSRFTLIYKERAVPISIKLPGLFNVYNALAAAALGIDIGVSPEDIKGGLENYTTLFGRSERLVVGGKSVLIQLIKNPAGASQAIQAAVGDPHARLLIAINDNYADGRDVSWLWDAEFELLETHGKTIFVSGTRAHDMAVRLKYCGINTGNIQVVPSLESALRQSLSSTTTGETLWVLPTYTCLLELQKIARAQGTSLSGT
jgi:lipid II isoglutaminyl synthase (glutamine-hydrolysing)